MTALKQSLPLRLAHSLLQFALRLWPEESRQWGHALATELHEIENPWEALHWAIGGLMLFTRASASHFFSWLKLPAGSTLSAASLPAVTGSSIIPKRSRLFTLAILLATAVVLLLPQSREAISTVRASWNGYQGYSSDLSALQNLASRAESEKDAHTLAFVALATPNRERSMELADRAVAIDSSLVWIYANSKGDAGYGPPSKDGLARLLAADPDNAFPELVAARTISEPLFQKLIYRNSPTKMEIESSLAADPRWTAHMDRAFRARHFDSYFNQQWQLTREVWYHHQYLSASVIFHTLWAHWGPDLGYTKIYGDHLVHLAQKESADGHVGRAEALLKRVDEFGSRMSEQGETYFEKAVGLSLSYQATKEFRNLYQSHGMELQSQEAARHLQEVDGQIESLRHSFQPASQTQARDFYRRAFLVQLSAVLAILFGIAALLSLFALELPPSNWGRQRIRLRRTICVAADWAPTALLFGCIGLLWLFQPYAQILRSTRSLGTASEAWNSMHFEGLFTLSSTLGVLEDPFTPVLFWQSLICALVALALFILVRRLVRYKRA